MNFSDIHFTGADQRVEPSAVWLLKLLKESLEYRCVSWKSNYLNRLNQLHCRFPNLK
jgi:hypothetical protein